MKIRDLITVSKEESHGFTEVTAELPLKASCTVSPLQYIFSRDDHVEQAEIRAVSEIDGFLFGDARLAFDEFERSMVLHLDRKVFRDVELYEKLQEKSVRVRKLLSIDGERG